MKNANNRNHNYPQNRHQVVQQPIPNPMTQATANATPESRTYAKVFVVLGVVAIMFAILMIVFIATDNTRKTVKTFEKSYVTPLAGRGGPICYNDNGVLKCDNNPYTTEIELEDFTTDLGQPTWVVKGLEIYESGDMDNKQAIFAKFYKTKAYRLKDAEWCKVLGHALFENADSYDEDQLARIERSLVSYMGHLIET